MQQHPLLKDWLNNVVGLVSIIGNFCEVTPAISLCIFKTSSNMLVGDNQSRN
jgi:hypothetical protein